jgi:hypothetical protein
MTPTGAVSVATFESRESILLVPPGDSKVDGLSSFDAAALFV